MKIMDMIKTHPQKALFDERKLEKVLEAITECAEICTECADACLGEPDPRMLVQCIRLNQDCADICEVTARVVSRHAEGNPSVARHLLQACAAICATCGEECERHASHHEHCRICAGSCRSAEDAIDDLLQTLPSM